MQLADLNRQGVAPTTPTSAVPNSPLNAVANFAGSNASLGNPRAVSMGVGGFGSHPDIPADQAAAISKELSGLVYSVAAGGYLTADEANNANSWYNKFGNGSGGDSAANQQAKSVYGQIGNFPTVANTSPALARFYALGGGSPAQGPSINSQLPGGDPWQGPWDFGHRQPGFNQFGVYNPGNV